MEPVNSPLEIAPQYFRELWIFFKTPNAHAECIKTPEQTPRPYQPWTAFVTGITIFLSILALDATQSVRHFDRVVFFTIVLSNALGFMLAFHLISKALGGRASLTQAICAGEYLVGFLLPSVTLVNYCIVSLVKLFPGVDCSLGYFTLDAIVPTAFNRALITLAIGAMLFAIGFCVYRVFILFSQVEHLNFAKTVSAMIIACLPLILLHSWLGFLARLFSGQLRKIAGILTGS